MAFVKALFSPYRSFVYIIISDVVFCEILYAQTCVLVVCFLCSFSSALSFPVCFVLFWVVCYYLILSYYYF